MGYKRAKNKMKKFFLVSLMLMSSLFFVFAETVDIKYGNKTIGTLEYSYNIQPGRSGCFITVTIKNNSEEYVGGTVKATGVERGCSEPFDVSPYGKTEVIIGCDEPADGVKLLYVHVK